VESKFFDNWTTQLRKGILELGILNVIRGNRLYGYDIAKKLSAIDGLVVGEGTIYPILSRFKREGLVTTTIEESPDGPARKYYQLTKQGETYLALMNEHWKSIKSGIDTFHGEQTS